MRAAAAAPAEDKRKFKSLFVASMAHPIRVKCLARMAEADTSPSAIARELRLDTPAVNYHVKALLDHDLIEKVDQRPVRGAVENLYRTIVVPVLWDEEINELKMSERWRYVETLLSLYGADATYALESGTLLKRTDWVIARTSLDVDPQGWRDISAVYAESMERIAVIKAESEERIRAKGGKPNTMRILAYQSLFEIPPRRHAQAKKAPAS